MTRLIRLDIACRDSKKLAEWYGRMLETDVDSLGPDIFAVELDQG